MQMLLVSDIDGGVCVFFCTEMGRGGADAEAASINMNVAAVDMTRYRTPLSVTLKYSVVNPPLYKYVVRRPERIAHMTILQVPATISCR